MQTTSNGGWSQAEREVMMRTDVLYEELLVEGRRRPSRSAVREAVRTVSGHADGMEVIYRHEADGRTWRRSCRAAANELEPEVYGALATLSVAGSDMAHGLAGAEARRQAKRERSKSAQRGLDPLFDAMRERRRAGVSGAEVAEAMFALDTKAVLECLASERAFAAALIERYAEAPEAERDRALVLAAARPGLVRHLRPYVRVAQLQVEREEIDAEAALASLRERAERRRGGRKRAKSDPAEPVPELPKPSREGPERIWEFPSLEELAEATRPMLPAGPEARPSEAEAA